MSNDNRFNGSKALKEKGIVPFKGCIHSEATKQKMRKSKNVGERNSQFGTICYPNGTSNKKIKSSDTIPIGWTKGRVTKPL